LLGEARADAAREQAARAREREERDQHRGEGVAGVAEQHGQAAREGERGEHESSARGREVDGGGEAAAARGAAERRGESEDERGGRERERGGEREQGLVLRLEARERAERVAEQARGDGVGEVGAVVGRRGAIERVGGRGGGRLRVGDEVVAQRG